MSNKKLFWKSLTMRVNAVLFAVPTLSIILTWLLAVLQNDEFVPRLIALFEVFGLQLDAGLTLAFTTVVLSVVGMMLRSITGQPLSFKLRK